MVCFHFSRTFNNIKLNAFQSKLGFIKGNVLRICDIGWVIIKNYAINVKVSDKKLFHNIKIFKE